MLVQEVAVGVLEWGGLGIMKSAGAGLVQCWFYFILISLCVKMSFHVPLVKTCSLSAVFVLSKKD